MAPRADRLATTMRAGPAPTPVTEPRTRATMGKAGKKRTDWTPEAA